MEEKKGKAFDSKTKIIRNKWICIGMITYFPIGFIILRLVKLFTKNNLYEAYYLNLITDFLLVPGFSLILTGFIINMITYFVKYKNRGKMKKLIVALCCLWIITSIILFKFSIYKDLYYVVIGNYC